MMSIRLALCATLFAAVLPTPQPIRVGGLTPEATQLAAEATALLEAEKGEEALAKSELALEWSPDSLELLQLASRAADAASQNDKALWYCALALEQANTPEQAATAEALKQRMADLDPLSRKDEAVLAAYAATLLDLGRDCVSRKLWVNAVGMYTRCRGTPSAAAAEAALAKIYEDKHTVEALLDSGLDVPIKPKKRSGAARDAAAQDKKHESWDKAWQIKGDCYTINTNLPRDLAEQMSIAMEQMNRFYRKVFKVKELGGNTARVVLNVYRTRAEFDAHEKENGKPVAKEVKGFFSPGELKVVTYDPRDEGSTLADLWSTLFHESSHQFTHMISADLIPAWLNEGTASYFEGARLLPNGAAETNLVPPDRLWELKIHLDEGKPTLKDVVSYFQPGSYPGEYYPFGWSLVYFFLNYENDKSQRIYEPLYRDYMAAYKSGGKHDVVGRFVDFFVTKAKDPAVKNFDDFEKRWKAWMLDLHAVYFGGQEKADVLIARGRKQRTNKAYESAVESFRWALRKRPNDVVATFELGDVLATLKQNDSALFQFQAAIRGVRAMADPSKMPTGSDKTGAQLSTEAQARIVKLNKDFGEKLAKVEDGFVSTATATAKAYSDKGLSLFALSFLDRCEKSFGESRALSDVYTSLRGKNNLDVRRWQRLPVSDDLAAWTGSDRFKGGANAIHAAKDGGGFLFLKEQPELPYRLETRIECGNPADFCLPGVIFGLNDDSAKIQAILVMPPGIVVASEFDGGWNEKADEAIGTLQPEQFKSFTLALEVGDEGIELFVDGQSIGKKAYPPEKLRGAIGIYAESGDFTFKDLRLKD